MVENLVVWLLGAVEDDPPTANVSTPTARVPHFKTPPVVIREALKKLLFL